MIDKILATLGWIVLCYMVIGVGLAHSMAYQSDEDIHGETLVGILFGIGLLILTINYIFHKIFD